MRENVGGADRVLRSLVGPGLLMLGYRTLKRGRARMGGIASLVGGALLTETAVTRVCPLNQLMGINTRR